MKVTYIKHSGYMAEWEDIVCLFDCAEGDMPEVDPQKRLFVFVSHAHSDHFNPEILKKYAEHPRHTFVLSSDIRTETPDGQTKDIFSMEPDRKRVFSAGKGVVSVSTLGSTDQGVAFVVNYAGKTVYHAGDLHWWAWPDDTPEEEKTMKNQFFNELTKIKGIRLDVAFLPLDPRLGGNFWMGFDAAMRASDIRCAYPMHMWDRYETVEKLRGMSVSAPYRDRIAAVSRCGQVFEYGKEVRT